MDLDSFLTPELQESLKDNRDKKQKKDDDRIERERKELEAFKESKKDEVNMDTLKLNKLFKKSKKEKNIQEHDENLWRTHGTGLITGEYEIVAVITHKGRSADSGHYVGWTQAKGGNCLFYNRYLEQI